MTDTDHPTHIDVDLQGQMQSVLASYFRRLQDARDENQRNVALLEKNRELEARLEQSLRTNILLGNQLKDSQAREAVAIEQAGVLKGIMHAHGASIADVVGKIQTPPPAPPQPETPSERAGLASVESALGSGEPQRQPGTERA